jgi:5-hydroxyisourate hydrolase
MSSITTHVLDTALGKPAAGIPVSLDKQENGSWRAIAKGTTDPDGRCRDLIGDAPEGIYRLVFHVGPYFAQQGRSNLYPQIVVSFRCSGEAHYHLPLLLSDNSYTTYRGS